MQTYSSVTSGDIQMPKKVLIALPPAMLEQIDYIAMMEHRTRSDLIREALRRYIDNFKRESRTTRTVDTLPSGRQMALLTQEG
jgi:predicted transcriptional regulator